eukprot:913187-Pyramimonas_sp.AAC.1
MAIPAMATTTQVDGPAGRNSGSGMISRIGSPEKFIASCKVMRYTEKQDMRTDKGRRLALNDLKTEVPPGNA